MNVNPYLFFDDNCRDAFEFYAASLGVEVKAMLSMADVPAGADAPAAAQDRIVHACINLGDGMLMGSDWNCGATSAPYEKPGGFRIALNVATAAEAERAFAALGEGGSVQMPLEKTFFAERFGMLTDRFGMPWMVSCDAAD